MLFTKDEFKWTPVAAVVFIGVLYYSLSSPLTRSGKQSFAYHGQRSTPINPSQKISPSAPSTTPPIDNNVPPEKFAPPISPEPRIDN